MFFLFYLAFGATIFAAIEGPLEKKAVEKLLNQKKLFIEKYPCLQGKVYIIVNKAII